MHVQMYTMQTNHRRKTSTNTRNWRISNVTSKIHSAEFNWNKWHFFLRRCMVNKREREIEPLKLWIVTLKMSRLFFASLFKPWYYPCECQCPILNAWLNYVRVFICIFNLPKDSWRRFRTIFKRQSKFKQINTKNKYRATFVRSQLFFFCVICSQEADADESNDRC